MPRKLKHQYSSVGEAETEFEEEKPERVKPSGGKNVIYDKYTNPSRAKYMCWPKADQGRADGFDVVPPGTFVDAYASPTMCLSDVDYTVPIAGITEVFQRKNFGREVVQLQYYADELPIIYNYGPDNLLVAKGDSRNIFAVWEDSC
jgi:hypothetical protein